MQSAHEAVAGAPIPATLLIDMAWLQLSSAKVGIHVDVPALSRRLEQQLGCQFMYKGIFTAKRPDLADNDKAQMTPHTLIQFLKANHFDVQVFTCKPKSCSSCKVSNFVQPGSVDAALCLGVANAVIARRPLLVLVAGDGDFAFVIQWMKSQASTNFTFILAVPSKEQGMGVSPDLIAQTASNGVIEFARWEGVSTPRVAAKFPQVPGNVNHHIKKGKFEAQQTEIQAGGGQDENEPGVGDAGALGNKVFVTGLPPKTSKISLEQAMKQFGVIIDCFVGFDKDGKPKGFGVVTYKSSGSVRKAIAVSKQYVVDEQQVVIKEFKSKPKAAAPKLDEAAGAAPVDIAAEASQSVAAQAAPVAESAPAQYWSCQSCTFRNELDRASCEMCNTNADASSAVSNVWACTKCTFENSQDQQECEMCGTGRAQ